MSDPSATSGEAPPPGYRSAASQARFRTFATVVLVLFGVLQFLGPMAMMIPLLPKMAAMQQTMLVRNELGNGAFFEGEWWYPTLVLGQTGHRTMELRSLRPEEGATPVMRHALPMADARLFADGDEIQVLSASQEGTAGPNHLSLSPVPSARKIAASTMTGKSPLYLRASGAAMELVEVTGDGDVTLHVFPPGSLPPRGTGNQSFRILGDGRTLHLFVTTDGMVQHAAIDIDSPPGKPAWRTVTRGAGELFPLLVEGSPAIVVSEGTSLLKGYVLAEGTGSWRESFSHPRFLGGSAAAFAAGSRVTVLAESFPGVIHMLAFEGPNVVADVRLTNDHPMAIMGPMMKMGMLVQIPTMLLPLLAALAIGRSMAAHRVPELVAESGRTVRLASLERRSLAHMADLLIACGPYACAAFWMFGRFANMDFLVTRSGGPAAFLGMFAAMAFGMAWMIVSFLLFSLMEGIGGWTPGKRLCGIAVTGDDLRPCGFGRGLLRNVCRLADCMFGYLPGIALVGFTQKRQRLGDLASRTIVVERASLSAPERESARGA